MPLKILSWNVNGFRSILKKNFLNWLTKEFPDILAIQETRVLPEQLPINFEDEYDYYFYLNPAKRKGYSGVGLLTRIKPNNVRMDVFKEGKFDDEGRVIVADYDNFSLFNIYFPNGKKNQDRLNYKMEFYDKFLDLIINERDAGKNIIFCGDINTAHQPIDLARPKANEKISGFLPIERQWIDKVIQRGFIDVFRTHHPNEPDIPEKRHYTWWSNRARGARERNVGWRIDYFFADKKLLDRIPKSFILSNVTGSDHCPIGIIFDN